MLIQTSKYYDASDPNLVLRFNYSETRELFEIKKFESNKVISDYKQLTDVSAFMNPATFKLDAATCNYGDWLHDPNNKLFYVCINGKQREGIFEWIDANAIYCRDTCPLPGFTCTKENFVRNWNNVT